MTIPYTKGFDQTCYLQQQMLVRVAFGAIECAFSGQQELNKGKSRQRRDVRVR